MDASNAERHGWIAMRPSFDMVRELAGMLPNVEYWGGGGTPALKVKGKLLAWLRAAYDAQHLPPRKGRAI